ncbi:MAG: amino acid permease, partial [Actinomycetota bacterium]
ALINMIMASRLVYGMSNQGILPGAFQKLMPGRRTPWMAIAFTTAIGVVLISTTGDLGILADTTVLLLLTVFAFVNVAVLALRRDRVDEAHFRAPSVFPVLGAGISIVLALQTLLSESGRPILVRAGVILLLGLVLWAINRLAGGGRGRIEAEKLGG